VGKVSLFLNFRGIGYHAADLFHYVNSYKYGVTKLQRLVRSAENVMSFCKVLSEVRQV